MTDAGPPTPVPDSPGGGPAGPVPTHANGVPVPSVPDHTQVPDFEELRRVAWKVGRGIYATDPPRGPGPLTLRRYAYTPPYSGIATFLGLPLCLTPEDLRAGAVDVAVLGAPLDMSVGHRGAAYGPRAIRADERVLFNNPKLLMNPTSRVSPFATLNVVDYGDAPIDPLSLENSMEPIKAVVREVADAGAVPIVMGGDHSLLWPEVAALAEVYGRGNVGVIHFDAHPDCADHILGHPVSHGTPIRRLIEDEHIPGRNFVQIGLRSAMGPDDELLGWMTEHGMRTHHMAEIDRFGFAAVLERAIAEALDGPRVVHLSIDIDVLDPAYACGTGTPEPPGLTPRELLPAVRRICHETPVIGMDVVEVAPHLDPTGNTAALARRAIFEGISGLAMRRLELPGPDYAHPAVLPAALATVKGRP